MILFGSTNDMYHRKKIKLESTDCYINLLKKVTSVISHGTGCEIKLVVLLVLLLLFQ